MSTVDIERAEASRPDSLALLRAEVLCLGTLVGIFLLVGCGGAGKTRFRFMNAVPDEPNIEVLVNDTSIASNLAYGTSTGYHSYDSGTKQVVIEPSGSTSALVTKSVTFSSGDTTMIVSDFSSDITGIVLRDDNSKPTSGDFKLRIVNAAPGLSSADVYVVAAGTNLNSVAPTLSNLAFGSASNYESATAGKYEVVITPVGVKSSVAVDTGSFTFSAGQIRTFVALNGQTGGFMYTILHDLN